MPRTPQGSAPPGHPRGRALGPTSADQFRAAEGTARGLGVQRQSLDLRQPPAYDYASALAAAAQEGAEALLVLRSPLFFRDRDRIIALAAQYRLPIMSGAMGLPEAGGLMAYGADNVDMNRRAATYVDQDPARAPSRPTCRWSNPRSSR